MPIQGHPAATGAPGAADADDLARELTRLLLRGVLVDFIAGPLVAAFTASALRPYFPARALGAWLVLFATAHLARLWLSRAVRRLHRLRESPRRALALTRLSVLAVGCGWALLPLCLFPADPTFALFVCAVICAVCGAGMAEYSADTPSALLFVLPQLLPLIAHLLVASFPLLRLTGMLAALYLAYLVHATWRTHGQFQRITLHRARAAAQLSRDPLTGLGNRLDLDQRLRHALARAARHGTEVAVGYIDLDHFKPVNDSLGHAAGDALLRELGARWRAELRSSELIARLGGDEFAILIEDLDRARADEQLGSVFERLHRAVERPFLLGGQAVSVGMTVGVARFPDDATEPDMLLRHADAAMYHGKRVRQHGSRRRWWPAASLAAGGTAPAVAAGPAA